MITVEEITTITELLQQAYPYVIGRKEHEGVFADKPLNSLIRAILSQNNNDRNRDKAYAKLLARYPTWESVLNADHTELAATIREANYSPTKASRIQAILLKLSIEQKAFTLDFLAGFSTEQVIAYLTGLPGIGRKSAAIVCLFALNRPVMPVDTHVFRVSQRLGWLPEKVSLEKAHDLLQNLIPPDLIFNTHIYQWEHGHTTCRPQPKCSQCVIFDYCHLKEKKR